MASITLEGVTKRFGAHPVLHGIDLAVADGEFLVLVGPSGCGKSTLLRMIAGLEEVTAGTLRIGDRIVNEVEPAERDIAMVFQDYALYPHMTVAENLGFGLAMRDRPAAEIAARVDEAARVLKIEPLVGRRPAELSGGQRQRVAMGRAIVRKPQVFLFDEPLSNLDAALRVQMRLEMARLHRRMRATTVYVTHDQVEAMTLADRIVVMRAGRIEQVGSPLELYNRPANAFVAGFIGSPRMNLVPATVLADDGTLRLRLGAAEIALAAPPRGLAPGTDVTLGVRPEHVAPAAADAMLALTVDLVEQLGNEALVYAAAPGLPQVTLRLDGQTGLARGAPIAVRFVPDHVHLFDTTGAAIARP